MEQVQAAVGTEPAVRQLISQRVQLETAAMEQVAQMDLQEV
jgi:hypothetical protein